MARRERRAKRMADWYGLAVEGERGAAAKKQCVARAEEVAEKLPPGAAKGLQNAAPSGPEGIDPITMERLLSQVQKGGPSVQNEALVAVTGLPPQHAAKLLEFALEKSKELRDPSMYMVSTVARGFKPRWHEMVEASVPSKGKGVQLELAQDRKPHKARSVLLGEFSHRPIRDLPAESPREAGASAGAPLRGLQLRDGLEFLVEASPSALPEATQVGLFIGLFSASHTNSEAKVEEWMVAGGTPPKHNPLRLWTMFTHQYTEHGGVVQPDELGDSCFGEAWRAEFCARVWTCLRSEGAPGGGRQWRIAVAARFAAGYRVEVYLGPPLPACRDYLSAEAQRIHPAVSWWAPPVAEHAVPSLSGMASHAAFLQLRLLFVNRENYWWGKEAEVLPSSCWLDLMQASVNSAMDSPAARPERYGLRPAPLNPHGLWLEFGVGSGKTTAAIAMQMRALVGQSATLHGFDSFQGLPSDWDYTHLGAGTFSTGGQVPPHLLEMPNVRIHMGLFSETLGDLDEFGTTPVAFAHIDVDIFPSAIEVLSRIACQLMAGSVLVYDELVNYVGFELSGEYRAWEYVASTYGIGWQYAGMYWQQAVPIVITQAAQRC
ncbi:26S proteasome non-ATPase regulatory subunit 13 [Durusdinium trenchii]|uniref:26S proteasome non-ATPase regulatory subunit 13 n=1 Tax=Durusdinium trenchii TaxID=1381693 RepID=A0ABP0NP52_9DINO